MERQNKFESILSM